MGYSFGHPPPGINGAGPIVGPPASNRSAFGGGVGLGEGAGLGRVGSGVGDGLAVAVAVAVGEAPAVANGLPSGGDLSGVPLLRYQFW